MEAFRVNAWCSPRQAELELSVITIVLLAAENNVPPHIIRSRTSLICKTVKLKKELWYFSNTFLFVSVDLDDETKENESKEKVGEENVPLVEEIQVPSGRCLVEEERQAGGQKRTEAWILETSLYK